MPRKFISPSERWPGSVTLVDPMPMSMVLEYERLTRELGTHFCPVGLELLMKFQEEQDPDAKEVARKELNAHALECFESNEPGHCEMSKFGAKRDSVYLPFILRSVEKWELGNFPEAVTEESFPGTPRLESGQLFDWLVRCLDDIYSGNEATETEKKE